MIVRLYTEKRNGFDIEAGKLSEELSAQMMLDEPLPFRILNRYDVLLPEGYDPAPLISGVFSEVNTDNVYMTKLPVSEGETAFGIEYLPGQYDARSDAAEQCARLIDPALASIRVRSAKIYIFRHDDPELKDKLLNYLLNPVDSRIADLISPPDSESIFTREKPLQSRVISIPGFAGLEDGDIAGVISKYGLAMDTGDVALIRDHFRDVEKRDITLTELMVMDAYWSDHCRHTTFHTHLTQVGFGPGEINRRIACAWENYIKTKAFIGRADNPSTLMDVATAAMRANRKKGLLDDLDISAEVNACSYKTDVAIGGRTEEYIIQFKNETHNHPTEIEPFGGAATCLGGAIRDPLSGRAYVYQSMRVTGSADPRTSLTATIPGKLPQRRITTQAARGFSSYGNQIGLCTGQVKEYYHPAFAAKRMEVGAVVAASPASHVRRAEPEPGDIIYVIGGRTGRDGIGGASGSSKTHDASSVQTAASEVQKGNAPEERKLQRLFRNPDFSRLIKKCNDFGAGGVCVAIGELAGGVLIDLDSLLVKYEGMTATELAVSESQERMAALISPADEERFLELVSSENLEYSKTALVTADERLVMTFGGEKAVDIPRSFMETNGTVKTAAAFIDLPGGFADWGCIDSIEEALKQRAASLPGASQEGLIEMFDNSIGAATVLYPFGGRYFKTASDVMAALVPVLKETEISSTATVMAHAYDPALAERNSYLGAFCAVACAVLKLACAGCPPERAKLSLQEYFGRLGEDPSKWGSVLAAVLGAFEVQQALGVSAVGGKDSMSGTYLDMNVPPTLIAFAVADIPASSVRANVLHPGKKVWLLTPNAETDGLTDLSSLLAMTKSLAAAGRKIEAASPVLTDRNVLFTIANMLLGEQAGFAFDKAVSGTLLASANPSSCIIGADSLDGTDLEPFATFLGVCDESGIIAFGSQRVDIKAYQEACEETLSSVFPPIPLYGGETKALDWTGGKRTSLYAGGSLSAAPAAVIPAFPGTNCEYDTARAFNHAGVRSEIILFRNLTAGDIDESVRVLAKAIETAQILALPGGFSAGDEPDGSAKYIVSALKNPRIRDAVHALLDRGGLILGICNGFQALIKTGLLPYGRIMDLSPDSPALTFNTAGRHIAKLVHTRIASSLSPWLALAERDAVYTVPISHGEGRFAAGEDHLRQLADAGQIACQYCEADGSVTGRANPNGSALNIEALSSPDGRIFGKMGHSERVGASIGAADRMYTNVPPIACMRLFEAGAAVFK